MPKVKKAQKTTSASATNKTKKSRPTRRKVTTEKKEITPEITTPVMPQNNQRIKVISALIGLLVIVGLLLLLKNWLIVATVNGQPITRFEFNQALEAQAGKQVLTTMVTEKLIFQEAEKKGVTVSQQEVDTAMKQVTDSLAKQGQTLDQALALQGMTKNEFVERIKIQKLVEKMFAKNITVSDKEIDDYLDQNKDALPQDQKPEDLRASVKKQLEQQKLSAKFQSWLQTIQKNAKVTYAIKF